MNSFLPCPPCISYSFFIFQTLYLPSTQACHHPIKVFNVIFCRNKGIMLFTTSVNCSVGGGEERANGFTTVVSGLLLSSSNNHNFQASCLLSEIITSLCAVCPCSVGICVMPSNWTKRKWMVQ